MRYHDIDLERHRGRWQGGKEVLSMGWLSVQTGALIGGLLFGFVSYYYYFLTI